MTISVYIITYHTIIDKEKIITVPQFRNSMLSPKIISPII